MEPNRYDIIIIRVNYFLSGQNHRNLSVPNMKNVNCFVYYDGLIKKFVFNLQEHQRRSLDYYFFHNKHNK